nr:MAG TPA: hypothetical protein [Caudoviricetes sp.]
MDVLIDKKLCNLSTLLVLISQFCNLRLQGYISWLPFIYKGL